MFSESRQQRRIEAVCNLEHELVRATALDKGVQLIFEVLGLLTRETRYGAISPIALPRRLMALAAVLDLCLQLVRVDRALIRCAYLPREDNRQDGRQQPQS